MVYDAEQGARNAEADTHNDPGYCQQQTRIWSGIPALYGDAATAWRNTNDRHPGDKFPPRGAHVFWTGGSHGYGHVGMSLGNQQVRSTDAGGSGIVATRHIDWFAANWGLPYGGWAWDNNEVTIPHDQPKPPPPKEDPVPDYLQARLTKPVKLKDGAWYPIDWDTISDSAKDYFTKGSPGVKIQGPYSANLSVTVNERTNSARVQAQFIEFKDGESVETNPVDSFGSVDNARTAQVGSVAKGRVLRARVRVNGGAGTLQNATIGLLTFQPK